MNSFHLHLIFVFCFTQLLNVAHGCHDTEREALLNFKSSLVIYPPTLLSSWQQGHVHRNCCNWHGVECSHEFLHVISVDLRDKNRGNYINEINNGIYKNPPPTLPPSLKGKISPYLFNLTHLEHLDLSSNDFQGSGIPHHFNNLKKLIYLDISFSSFSGSITTQFSNLSSLQYLNLSCLHDLYNPDNNAIFPYSNYWLKSPSLNWVRGLHNLEVLYLTGVDLYEASSSSKINFGQPFSSLSNLRDLDLSSCNISTAVFPEFHNHSRLSSLEMSDNPNFQSTIPIQLANFTSLSKLDLVSCDLQGSIPYLPQLEELLVSDNPGLHPSLSKMFAEQWPKLRLLYIKSTKVMGPLPSSISSNAPSLIHLIADSCSIQGSIPSSICNISSLQDLSLSSNNLTGTIPHCITKLRNLMNFDVTNNSICGNVSLIPLINELNLHSIDLDPNNLTVVIDEDQHLSKFQLEILSLKSCNLKGSIPTFICNLTLLQILDLSSNNLTGAIPFCIFKMNNLIGLDLSQNNLQGTLPRILHLKYHRYAGVNLSYNSLHGALPLPPNFFLSFDLSHNNFSGEISIETGERLSTVLYIVLSNNELSGSIPFSICPTDSEFSSGPAYIGLSNNKLSGVIPTSIGNCISLTSLELETNKLSGVIPTSIGYCTNLMFLNLGNNNLTGSVPKELEAIHLRVLLLNNNKLEGTVLNSVSKYQALEILNLANNNFEGSMPAEFGSLSYSLRIISLRSNKFSGSIPEEIVHFSMLQIVDFSGNYFSGQLPMKIGSLEMLTGRPNTTIPIQYAGDVQLEMVIKGIEIQLQKVFDYSSGIDLSCNILEGSIPEEIGLLKGLSMLNLSHNGLSGIIPASVGNMTGLDSLDLSFNKLFRQIPESLASLDSLGYLNLSYNNLSGRIPRGLHLDTLSGDGSAYVNNSFLCGFLTNNICEEGDQRTNTPEEDNEEDAKDKLLLCAIVVLGFVVGFWGLFLVLLLKKEKLWFPYWRLVDIIARKAARCGLEM